MDLPENPKSPTCSLGIFGSFFPLMKRLHGMLSILTVLSTILRGTGWKGDIETFGNIKGKIDSVNW